MRTRGVKTPVRSLTHILDHSLTHTHSQLANQRGSKPQREALESLVITWLEISRSSRHWGLIKCYLGKWENGTCHMWKWSRTKEQQFPFSPSRFSGCLVFPALFQRPRPKDNGSGPFPRIHYTRLAMTRNRGMTMAWWLWFRWFRWFRGVASPAISRVHQWHIKLSGNNNNGTIQSARIKT